MNAHLIGIGFLIAAWLFLKIAASSPEGYEDETGFHYGRRDEQD